MIRALIIIFFTCACTFVRAQVDIITTISGNGLPTGGYCCDSELAIHAILNYPFSLRPNSLGDIIFSDAFNQRIRKIDHSTGIITTIAGTGVGGYSGDSGLAVNAQLFLPSGIIIDSHDNIYLADAGNMVVRKIDGATNIITTIAGNGISGDFGDNGLAINAQLNGPCGLCFDKFGNIIIADEHNNKIRKVDISTGIITTIAGTGIMGYSGDSALAINAELNRPGLLSIDSLGSVFFSDVYNSVIRKIDVSTGIITTIAGNGTSGFFCDNGQAIDAEFWLPIGLFIDKQQNIYIADDENGAVRKINASTGVITTIAGIGVPGYSGDNGPATSAQVIPTDIFFDSAGNMFIADAGNNSIRKVNNATGVSTVINLPEEVNVYPNPASEQLTITSTSIIKRMEICNFLGQTINSNEYYNKMVQVDISALPTGVYLIRVNGAEVRKFVKE